MSKKIPIEEIRKIYKKNGLELLETESKGITKSYKCKDDNGYVYYYSAKHLKDHGISDNAPHIFSSRNPFSWDNVQLYMDKYVKNGTKLLSTKKDWKNRDSILTFQCGVCGGTFKKSWGSFKALDFKICTKCFNVMQTKGKLPSKRTDPFVFHNKLKELGMIPLCGDDLTYNKKALVQDKEGYRGYITLSSAMGRDCKFDRFSTKNPFSLTNLRLYAFLKEWDCIIPDQKYNGDKGMLEVICSCGRNFNVTTGHFLGGKYKCNSCRGAYSLLSEKVEKYLIKLGKNYIREKRFEKCRNITELPFDFFVENRYCIEVDGQQHYTDRIWGKESFIKNKNNEAIKNRFCKENGIPLLRIPYWEIEDGETYKKRLNEFLSIKD